MAIKPEIKYGFAGGIGLIAWTLIEYLAGFHTSRLGIGQYSGYVAFVVIYFSLRLGLLEKEADSLAGMSLRKSIREAVIQLIITAVVASSFMMLYDYKINPLWVEEFIVYQREHGHAFGVLITLANDPAANAIILSNTEMHLCIYALSILMVGASMAFMIHATSLGKKPAKN